MKKSLIQLICLFMTLFIYGMPILGDEESNYNFYINAIEKLRDKDKKFSDIIIKEISEYIQRFPNASNLDEMQFKIASIYSNNKDKVSAFFAHMELIYLYPNSKYISVAKDRVRSLLTQDGKFKSLTDQTDNLINPQISDTTKEGMYFTFIRDLFEYKFEPTTKILLASCNKFLTQFPQSPEADAVLFWKANLLSKDKHYREALAEYMKLTYLYTESIYVTTSKLRMADLYTEKLNMHQDAIKTLEEFLLEFPEDPQAGFAQYRMAQIIEKKKKKYLDALKAYTTVAEKYPESLEAVPALFEAARLYEDKFKEYEQAIRIYTQIVRDFSDDIKAPYALVESGRIYEKRLKDFTNAAQEYLKIFEQYPESKIAGDYLYKAAEIYEKKINDLNQAITLYRKVVDNYPNKKIAEKASKRIDKLTKEIDK